MKTASGKSATSKKPIKRAASVLGAASHQLANFNEQYIDECITEMETQRFIKKSQEASAIKESIKESVKLLPKQPKPKKQPIPEPAEYNVEKIVDKKYVGRKAYYFVKWENYDSDVNTWEPTANLGNVKDMVKRYNDEEAEEEDSDDEDEEEEVEVKIISKKKCRQKLTSPSKDKGMDEDQMTNIAQQGSTNVTNQVVNADKDKDKLSQKDAEVQSAKSVPNSTIPMHSNLVSPKVTERNKKRGRPAKNTLTEVQIVSQSAPAEKKPAIVEGASQTTPILIDEEVSVIPKPPVESVKAPSVQPIDQSEQILQLKSPVIDPIKETVKPAQKKFTKVDSPVKIAEEVVQPTLPKTRKKREQKAETKQPVIKKTNPPPKKSQQTQITRPLAKQSPQPILSQAELSLLPKEGSFATDKPLKVIGAKVGQSGNGSILVSMEWQERANGFKPKQSQFSNDIVRSQCPELLVDFYESRINLKKQPAPAVKQPSPIKAKEDGFQIQEQKTIHYEAQVQDTKTT